MAVSAAPLVARADGQAEIGSSRVVSAAPGVPHPGSKPCSVELFYSAALGAKDFAYSPPADCAGPWAAVVLSGTFTISPGSAGQRLIRVSVGGASLYIGSAPAPLGSSGQSWNIERDVTDYSALLKAGHRGEAALEFSSDVAGGEVLGSVRLDFYRADMADPAHRTPDAVLPIGDFSRLSAAENSVSENLTLPRNIERAYMDVAAIGEGADEDWYLCAPAGAANRLGMCAGEPYREAEVMIDGQPAGIAPVYPLLAADAVDSRLWAPIAAPRALGATVSRVDVTPFAGVLSDGAAHEVSLSVYGTTDRFVAAGSLLLYLDRAAARVTGAVTVNTLDAEPAPKVATTATGGRGVSVARQFTIVGYVNTPRGKIETRVDGSLRFTNEQGAAGGGTNTLLQTEEFTTAASTRQGGVVVKIENRNSFPLRVEFTKSAGADGRTSWSRAVDQGYEDGETDSVNGTALFSSTVRESVSGSDPGAQDSDANLARTSGRYFYSNSLGACYSRILSAAGGLLSSVANGQGCPRAPR